MFQIYNTSFYTECACKCFGIYIEHLGLKRLQDEQNVASKAPKKRKTSTKGVVVYYVSQIYSLVICTCIVRISDMPDYATP